MKTFLIATAALITGGALALYASRHVGAFLWWLFGAGR